MPRNENYTEEYLAIIKGLNGDVQSRRAALRYMQASSAIVHHEVVASSFLPRLFNAQTYRVMKHTAETAHRILCKVILHYLSSPSYRKVFSFDPRLEELILLPRGYDSLLPFVRVDTFLDEDTYRIKFCEFNGDGSSGMNENREITHSIESSTSYKEFATLHQVKTCELFESWVQCFLDIYATYKHRVEKPRIAICDYLENGVVDEFYIYAKLFKSHGFDCVVSDVRDLSFDGQVLYTSDNQPVNAIWRRCVTNDVLDHWDQSQELICAVRDEKVALIGSFAGHIVHDKQIFKALFNKETLALMDAEEISFIEKTVPLTAFLDDESVNLPQIRDNKNEWIIKPTDHYGADEVYAGCSVSQAQWEELIDRFANSRAGYPFIVQRYISPFKTLTLPPDDETAMQSDTPLPLNPQHYNNLNGLYLYDGNFQGVFSRLGPYPTISKEMKGITAATLWVDRDNQTHCDDAL